MDDIDQVYDLAEENKLITETAKKVQAYIKETWPQFTPVLEVPMRDIFPDPGGTNRSGLQRMWAMGAADIVVWRNVSLPGLFAWERLTPEQKQMLIKSKSMVSIFEPGGAHHFEKKQWRRDKCKWKLCQLNGVRCLRFANSLPDALSKRKLRAMIGKFLFGMK